MKKNIPVFSPLIEMNEIRESINSLKKKYLGVGEYVEKFEKISSKILGINENKVCSVNTAVDYCTKCQGEHSKQML